MKPGGGSFSIDAKLKQILEQIAIDFLSEICENAVSLVRTNRRSRVFAWDIIAAWLSFVNKVQPGDSRKDNDFLNTSEGSFWNHLKKCMTKGLGASGGFNSEGKQRLDDNAKNDWVKTLCSNVLKKGMSGTTSTNKKLGAFGQEFAGLPKGMSVSQGLMEDDEFSAFKAGSVDCSKGPAVEALVACFDWFMLWVTASVNFGYMNMNGQDSSKMYMPKHLSLGMSLLPNSAVAQYLKDAHGAKMASGDMTQTIAPELRYVSSVKRKTNVKKFGTMYESVDGGQSFLASF
jgi:hypothetical protein